MNESTEVTFDQVAACFALFKAAKRIVESDESYIYSRGHLIADLIVSLDAVALVWDW